MIEDFLAFARIRKVSIQPVILKDLLTKLQVGFSEYGTIEFELEFSKNFPVLHTDGDALEQILLNIIKNSVQSCSKDGKIVIKCEQAPKSRVRIHITDNGPGIPVEFIDRIFDPFFTTKDEGSGLGLAISKRLIEQLDGKIFVKSSPGKGTTATISLPN